ncbi:MAG TPA: signal peptide peptidase SppA [Cyclobacteriaceae bacterium]|jgi:protease-4|nr:signal peptide peptidase SppA [Cyclobacteriaceae bacterium]
MSFFKAFWAAFLAFFLFVIVFIFLFVVGIASLSSEKETIIDDHSVLHLKLDAQITELQKENPFEGLPVVGNDVQNIGLIQLKQAIEHAKTDPKIEGIYLDISHPMAGFSTLEEIRMALIDFKSSGKWVLAYNTTMTEGAYYLASAADQVYLHPEGEVEFNGLTVEIGFYKKLFDKLEIKPEVFRVGEFKSAVEPFILEKMSDANRLQLTELVNSIYGHVIDRIADARKISKDRLKEISDKMLVRNARLANELGLVDSLLYDDEFQTILKNRVGLKDDQSISFVKYNKYRKSFSTYKSSKNEIAVIVADGTIMPGTSNQSDQVIGADTFVKEIRKAREDKDVKAIVLRVNSPGGEFRSSDMMWRELSLASKVKPVIASMGDYAASGGYYLSMVCDTIVAQPHTITGSIGIFGMMFDMSGFLGNKIGITFDEVKTGQFGEMYTVTRPLNEAERSFWQKNLDEHYETFTGKAAEGRHMAIDDLKKIASGRVWTGEQAKDRGLVDILGSFDDAIKIAATKAKVQDDYKVKYYPEQKPFFEQFFSQLEENAKANTIKSELGEYYGWYQQLQGLKTYQGAQARMPYTLEIH